MINQRVNTSEHSTTVTFSLEEERQVSVVGDFNGWEPGADPLTPRRSGLRSAAVDLPSGTVIRFRYLTDGGEYLDDDDAHDREPNGFGGSNGILHVEPR